MVFKQWEEVWQYYKTASPLKALFAWNKARVYWYLWVACCVSVLCGVGFVAVFQRYSLWIDLIAGCLPVLAVFLMVGALRRAETKEFAAEYANYDGLARSRDIRYLRYVRFLRALANQKYSREDIARLRGVVEIVDRPQRSRIQFNDHPFFFLLFIGSSPPTQSVRSQLSH